MALNPTRQLREARRMTQDQIAQLADMEIEGSL